MILTTIPIATISSASLNFALFSPTIAFPENHSDGAVTIIPEMSSTIILSQNIDTT
jgi:hypothetical protein